MHTLKGTNSARKLIRANISSGANGSDAFTSICFVIASALYLGRSPPAWPREVDAQWEGRGARAGDVSVKLGVETGKPQVQDSAAVTLSFFW